MCRRRVKKELFSSRARGLCPRKHGTSTTWNVPLSLTLHIQTLPPAFLQGFWRWRRVTKELFSSRVGFADIRRGAPTLARETALSLVCFSEKLLPCISAGFFVRWRRVKKELFSSRVGGTPTYAEAHTLAWETALSLTCFSEKQLPCIFAGFLALAESKERTLQFACRLCRHTPRGSHARAGNGVISCLFF